MFVQVHRRVSAPNFGESLSKHDLFQRVVSSNSVRYGQILSRPIAAYRVREIVIFPQFFFFKFVCKTFLYIP